MSRDLNHLAHLNAINDAESEVLATTHEGAEEDLSIFQNTNFYDFDIGRSTDIATTVDELLMQQEMQIQYPGKSAAAQEHIDHHGSNTLSNASGFGIHASASSSYQDLTRLREPTAGSDQVAHVGPQTTAPYPFDFSELQEFSLAGELPPVSNTRHFYPVSGAGQHYFTPGPTDLHHVAPRQHRLHEDLHNHTAPAEHAEPAKPKTRSPSDSTDEAKGGSDESGTTEIARQIADEDKRRRNTAASARFRIKKKLREQEMERNTRQMQARIEELENKLKQLEMENRWLKNLVVERNEKRDVSEIEKLRNKVLGSETKET